MVALTLALIFAVSISTAFMLPKGFQHPHIENVDVKIADVEDDYVDLLFSIRLSEVNDATVKIATYDLKTGILLNESVVKAKSREINEILRFEKDRDYRVKISLEKDGKVVDRRYVNLRYLDTLIPKDRELKVILRDVDFRILGVDKDKVNVLARYYFDSLKDYDVDFHVKVVQYESNVLTDERWVKVRLEKGKTNVVETNVTVINNYCYLVKLEAWRKNSIVKIWRSVLNLSPTKRIPKGFTEKEVKFEVEKFVSTPTPIPTPVVGESKRALPGFELLTLITAGGVAFCLRRLGRL